jgi:hypothetical protein
MVIVATQKQVLINNSEIKPGSVLIRCSVCGTVEVFLIGLQFSCGSFDIISFVVSPALKDSGQRMCELTLHPMLSSWN